MRMFTGIAAALAVAGGAAVAAGVPAQDRVRGGSGGAAVTRDGDVADVDDVATKVRQLAVLAGRGAHIGVSVRDLDPGQAGDASGALVEGVREQSPADKAGIRKGDIITEFDGQRVRGVRHLIRLVAETPDGHTVTAGVLREGRKLDLPVTPDSGGLAELHRDFDVEVPPMRFEHLPGLEDGERRRLPEGTWSFRGRPGEAWAFRQGRGRLGVRIQPLGQLAEYFGTPSGVLVNGVDPDSPAARAGLKAGDVVTAVNGKPVAEPSELIEAVRTAEGGATLTIDYTRDRKAQTVEVPLPETASPAEPKARRRVSPI